MLSFRNRVVCLVLAIVVCFQLSVSIMMISAKCEYNQPIRIVLLRIGLCSIGL